MKKTSFRHCRQTVCREHKGYYLFLVAVIFMTALATILLPHIPAHASSSKAVTLQWKTYTLEKKDTLYLNATVSNKSLASKKIVWKSSNKAVVAIQKTEGTSATVLAKKAGKATITATVKGTKNEASCKITVLNKASYHAGDKAAFAKIVQAQKAAGASVTGGDEECSWRIIGKQYRLTGISWTDKGLTGAVSFSKLPELRSVYCSNNKKLTSLDVSKNKKLDTLFCHNCQLADLDVSKNTQLTDLDCGNTIEDLSIQIDQLTSLDVSKNPKLVHLNCEGNQLKSLDLSKNKKLETLDCYFNQLTELDLSNNTKLKDLECAVNQLTVLAVDRNTELTRLNVDDNQLTALDVSKNKNLIYLYCSENQLSKLDVGSNPLLEQLWCNGNQLTSLDVSKNPELVHLVCMFNQLTSLDVSKNPKLENLSCDDTVVVTGK